MLFGMEKVGRRLHFAATCIVALGTLISATWIISANSWMQTPTGFTVNARGQFVPAGSWWPIVFNPSFPYRLVHTVIGAYLTTSLAVGGVGAWHLLRDRANPQARKMFSMAMWMAALVAPVQILAGDQQGLNTLEHQPVKVLAMEGDYDPSPHGAPLHLFGWPDSAAATVRGDVAIPHLGSLILRHDADAPLAGLTDFPRSHWPPVAIVFWSFRVMVALGLAMVAPPRRADGAVGIRCRHRRLGHHRSGPAAVHRLWPTAHGTIAFADRGTGCGCFAHRFRGRLFQRVRCGCLLSAATDVASAAER
jgi:cytochrome d ubiquinol oxidase subunit I